MGIVADIARYHLLVAVQRWAAPMLAILCAHDGLRASSQALPQLQFRASWAPPLTEELDATLRIRLAAMKVIVAAVKPDLLELVRKVEDHRITVPAAERRLLAMLPPAEDLAQEVLAKLMERVEAAKPNGGPPKHCNQYGHTGGKHCKLGAGQHDNRHAREGKTKPQKQQPVEVQPKGDKDKKKREKRAEKFSRTPEGKTLNRLLDAVDTKSETKNYSGVPIKLTEVSSKTRAKLKNMLNIDTKGWYHSISEQQIRHIQSGHSKEISKLEYQFIPDIQKNWNQLKPSDEDPSCLIFIKRFGGKKYSLVERMVTSIKGKNRFEVVTFYSNKIK